MLMLVYEGESSKIVKDPEIDDVIESIYRTSALLINHQTQESSMVNSPLYYLSPGLQEGEQD